ncbi:hypothetical protein RUM44_000911 [Polyplax serrata]|uniref:EGF-like domain-containing protein n=1 Tax=Polyplax serrata TaxID=468196 RepID=A0ABR1B7F0_POLSC
MCLAESYSALTAFGSSSTQNQQQNSDKQGSRRTRECKSDEECAAIQNTSCMSDPRDYKMRCLCRDSSAPINGACPNRPRAVGSPCKMDSECIDGSECKSMNITITSFKTCQCKDGYMSKDGYCSSK